MARTDNPADRVASVPAACPSLYVDPTLDAASLLATHPDPDISRLDFGARNADVPGPPLKCLRPAEAHSADQQSVPCRDLQARHPRLLALRRRLSV
uniref:Uncharacterized protein n=1 Tax=Mycena chlorophos TaxID=658473 RepID=A0ABQ0LMM5_MYCCL|nr:predicted protein [Mycena chlorophos]